MVGNDSRILLSSDISPVEGLNGTL
ncbi:uncharacterized protein METZ01_LOCUS300668 [marine metagenome]|uniref:Uncharacterized protein n=1 Tax=marine metagenome TaxID=408172 RepID=A0A382MFS9_9ZZZZ